MSTLAASSSSTSSPRCVPFAFRRGGRGRRLRQAPAAAAAPGGVCGCGRPLCRPDKVVQSAFFVSLDVCACVKVRTDSFRESSSAESEAAPLMSPPLPSSPPPHDAARGGGRSAGSGKPRRGLVGCCTPNSTRVVN